MKTIFPKLEKIRVNSLFYKLSAVFMAFFIIPVLISSVVLHNYSTRVVENEVNNANHSLLKHACELTDIKLMEIRRIIFDLSEKSYFKKLSDPVFSQLEAIQMQSMTIDHLRNIKNTNDFIDGVFVYYIANDYFFSNNGKLDISTYFTKICKYEGISGVQWKELFGQNHSFGILSTERVLSYGIDKKVENSRNLITILATLPFLEKPKAIIGIQVNENRIKEILTNIGLTKNGSIYVINSEGKMISHSKGFNNLLTEAAIDTDILIGKGMGSYISDKNGKSMNSFITSSFSGWTFVAEIPYSEISERFKIIKYVMLIICFSFILTGAAISLKLSSSVYNPIKDLVDRFLKNIENDGELKKQPGRNEFSVIRDGMENIISDNKKLKGILESNIDGIRQKILQDFISGKLGESGFVTAKAEAFGITFNYKYFTVTVMKFEFFKLAYEQFSGRDIENIKSGFCEVINAIVNREKIRIYSFPTGKNDYAAIINADTNDACILKHTLKEVVELFNYDENFVRLSISTSSFSSEVSDIPALYEEASRFINYRTLSKKSQIIEPKNAAASMESSGFYYPLEVEESIYNFMLAGNHTKAVELLNHVIDRNIEDNLAYAFLKEVFTSMMNTLSKIVKAKNLSFNEIFGPETALYEELGSFSEVDEIKESIASAYENTGKCIRDLKKSSNEKLIQEIINYLQENYNKDIYLEAVSDRVGSTSKYISRFFKEQTGINFLDYVNKLRIQKAKEFLLNKGSKVQDVCAKVGFDNVNSFIRVFKKYEGISPGQFKELQKIRHSGR